MNHLSNLRVFNYVMAGIYALATVITVALSIGTAAFGWRFFQDVLAHDPGAPPPEVVAGFVIGIFAVVALILLLESVLFLVTARLLARGRGRTLQTILAILTITSFPVGTGYAIYALWTCWSHPESKAVFDRAA